MRRPYLLDTCAAIWFMEATLPKKTIEALTEAVNRGLPTYVSPITAWEAGNLARKKKFKARLAPKTWFERLLAAPGMGLCEMPPAVLIASTELPDFPENDPVGRIIAATAREYGFTVVTRDRPLLEYGKQGYLNVLEC
jgi:PIN domain nuclease of toxin-antitoxin system